MTTMKKPPKIALIGRPNVGKSTLFNRFTRSKDAIVAERPGLTRDRRYGEFSLKGKRAILIDTGGIATDLDDPLSKEVLRQTELAIKEADLLLLMFDGKEGLVTDDFILVDMARKSPKPALAVVNKIDSREKKLRCVDFYETGFEPILDISAKSGRGLSELKSQILEILFHPKQ